MRNFQILFLPHHTIQKIEMEIRATGEKCTASVLVGAHIERKVKTDAQGGVPRNTLSQVR